MTGVRFYSSSVALEWRRLMSGTGDSDGVTTGITKLFLPNVLAAYKLVREIKYNNVIAHIMTGHGGFSEYLHRFRCKESPVCICDFAIDETVPHILFECQIFALRRYNLEQEVGCSVSLADIGILMGSKFREKFLSYCTEIANIVILRNKIK